jgi:hypothetical protein
MKHLILFFSSILFFFNSFGQWAIPAQMRAENTLDRLSSKNSMSASDILYGVPLPPGSVIGDDYLDKKWNMSTILLYQSEAMIEGNYTRYDIKADLIEVKTNSGIKALDVRKIKNMLWLDSITAEPHYYVNAMEFRKNGTQLTGLLEVVVDGNTPLLKRTEIKVKEPTYVVALDVGSRDTKIYKKEIYFYAREKDLFELKNKSDLLEACGDRSVEMEAYIKTNKLNINKPAGLKRAFEFLNHGK